MQHLPSEVDHDKGRGGIVPRGPAEARHLVRVRDRVRDRVRVRGRVGVRVRVRDRVGVRVRVQVLLRRGTTR